MLVFREGRGTQSGRELLRALLASIAGLQNAKEEAQSELALAALLRCGELECGLADQKSPHSLLVAAATDALAETLLSRRTPAPLPPWLNPLSRFDAPQQITVSIPEGFAYYALHPEQYADLADALPTSSASAAVVGIRSIGTTLSAVVAAALRRRGLAAERITVRPDGHPFDRKMEFSPAELRWITTQRARRAEFLVVDEGPGLSGSSFLSVGDALLQAGVSRASIAFLCGRRPDPDRLCARQAAQRWQEFRSFAAQPRCQPGTQLGLEISGGRWRQQLLDAACNWPASWVSMERAKFLSRDGRQFLKFEGLGHFGAKVEERSRRLAEAGFAPACANAGDGYLAYARQQGAPASRMDLCQPMLDRIAEYCAFRAREFHHAASSQENLGAMSSWNLHEEFGIPYQPETKLQVEARIISDGRMQPHEWLLTSSGILKTDGASHGDDHFFPGATDIAWDLAGAIVEWDLGPDAAEFLLQRYAALSGDHAQSRLPAWVQAYTAFRLGYCKMAAESLRGSREEERLLRDYRRYRARAEAALAQPAAA